MPRQDLLDTRSWSATGGVFSHGSTGRRFADEMGQPDNGLRIANKTGGWTGMRADMALVEWPGTRYVIGIVTEGDPDTRFWAENAGDRLIGRVSRLIFDHFGGRELPPAPASPTEDQVAVG